MTKLFSITLSALILIQSFNIGTQDLLRLDELIEHAQFHQQEHGDNFFMFISKHYGELKAEHSKNHQEEQNDHEQLPFQFQGHMSSIIAFIPTPFPYFYNNTEVLDSIDPLRYYFNFYSSLHKKRLLQPPKQA